MLQYDVIISHVLQTIPIKFNSSKIGTNWGEELWRLKEDADMLRSWFGIGDSDGGSSDFLARFLGWLHLLWAWNLTTQNLVYHWKFSFLPEAAHEIHTCMLLIINKQLYNHMLSIFFIKSFWTIFAFEKKKCVTQP